MSAHRRLGFRIWADLAMVAGVLSFSSACFSNADGPIDLLTDGAAGRRLELAPKR
jgi:hypothetical protein